MTKRILAIVMIFIILISISSIPTLAANNISDIGVTMSGNKLQVQGVDTNAKDAWDNIFVKYRNVIVGVSGIGALTMIALFIFMFMKLGSSAGNPSARSAALTGVLWTGIAAAGLGAVTIITAFFYNAL